MHQLVIEEHPDEIGQIQFSMKIVRGHKLAFTREVHKAMAIQRCQGKNLLNSKAEYN